MEKFTIFLQSIENLLTKLDKNLFFVWKTCVFLYNSRMPNFKTKKIPSARPVEPETPSAPTPTVKRKLRIFIGILLGIFTIIFWVVYAFQAVGSIKLSSHSGAILFQPLSNIFNESGSIIKTTKIKGTTNILVAGIGGKGHDGSELTDSLMLASINADDGFVTLLSIPRDLFVAYPKDIGGAGRINSLYGLGRSHGKWVNILAEKISEITGQSIDHYLVIDFSGFKQIVDTLGGIEVDVPTELIDREYPNDNWGYTTFVVNKWLQVFNGETALKYARSRHSTSDFDRSERQQLLIKAMKNKALSAGFITSPNKMSELFEAVRNNLDTDLTIGDITNYAIGLKDIDGSHINVYNLSNDCVGIRCAAWAYLYAPSREYFWWAAALIPENATAQRLSYYEDIRRFVDFIFQFPDMKNGKAPINIIYKRGEISKARDLIMALEKNGFLIDTQGALVESTGSTESSHINIYWNPEANAGFAPDHLFVKALKNLEDRIPYIMVNKNEYVTTRWPRIEIVLGNDSKSYFSFAKIAYYLPYITTPASSGNTISGTTVSWEPKKNWTSSWGKKQAPESTAPKATPATPFTVAPGEWENF
jgi:LCP family protein required for cell wall assembly